MAAIVHSSPPKNRLLAALPQADFERFFAELEPVSLTLKQVLYQVGDPLGWVYFVERGVVSVLTSMANGASIEVGMIGNEGIVGVAALLGSEASAQQIIVQVPGTALRIKASACRAAFEQSAAVRALMHRFILAFIDLGAQTAACNRLHSIEQRCARWLLMARDRVASDEMPMTHEFLATMLGVRRAGVTETIGGLQLSGLIRNHRGAVTIVDGDGLEAAACECYRIDHERLLRLI
jgi:CRP-like cAMP-binding protein